MASASSSTPPSASRSPLSRGPMKPMAADVFKPRLPRDPFAQQRPQPWALKPDAVIAALNAPRRDVILVLGAPSLKDLEPLLHSAYLAQALLILATHAPPQIPAAQPAVRVLRLAAPLAIEDAGAVRFVNILEAAERIARVWRKAGGAGVEEVQEADAGAPDTPLAPPQARFASSYGSAPPSASSSTDNISVASAGSRRRSFLSLPRAAAPRLPPVDAAQRPFDALLNFLPPRAPDKATLKQMILVTTISRPFLTSAAPANRSSSRLSVAEGESRRWSLARPAIYSAPTTPASNRSRTSLFPPDLPQMPRRAHIVHLIAPTAPSVARSKLMQSIEGFLCSFAYAAPGMDAAAGGMGDERAAPFLMHPYTLKATIASPESGVGAWSIADLLLSGSLDRPDSNNVARAPPRAWLSSANDIVLAPASRPVSQGSVSVSMPAVPSLQAPTPSPHRGRASQSFLGGAELGFVNAHASAPQNSTWSGVRRPEISLDSTSARGKGKERAPAQGLPTPPDSSADSDSAESVRPPSPVPAPQPERKGSVRGRGFFGGGSGGGVGGGGSTNTSTKKEKGGGLGIRWKFWKAAAVRA
ncbi:hypothetical protein HWV62_37741 [Athelia sp. TMB]|nr:hypothetical protein HWV62_37741 [Athelia sp. TMB]